MSAVFTVSRIVCSNIQLNRRNIASSGRGAAPTASAGKTPVPGTRRSPVAFTSSKKPCRLTSRFAELCINILNPFDHDQITKKSAAAIATVNQAPSKNFVAFALKNNRSTIPIGIKTSAHRQIDHFQCFRATITARNVVQTSVPVTVNPYALASREDEPKPMTATITAMYIKNVTVGIVICPRIVFEVCSTFIHGRNPTSID